MMTSHQDDYAIEVFQLENLIDNRIPFLFFGLFSQEMEQSLYSKAKHYSHHLQIFSEAEIEKQLKTKNKDMPVVLICEDGKRSQILAGQLQKKGFTNVFFIEGGLSTFQG